MLGAQDDRKIRLRSRRGIVAAGGATVIAYTFVGVAFFWRT